MIKQGSAVAGISLFFSTYHKINCYSAAAFIYWSGKGHGKASCRALHYLNLIL